MDESYDSVASLDSPDFPDCGPIDSAHSDLITFKTGWMDGPDLVRYSKEKLETVAQFELIEFKRELNFCKDYRYVVSVKNKSDLTKEQVLDLIFKLIYNSK